MKGLNCHGNDKRFEWKCYNYRKKDYIAKGCQSKKQMVENNAATFNTKEKSANDWGAEVYFTTKEEELARTVMTFD